MPKKKLSTRIKESSWQTTAAGILALAAAGAVIYGNATGNQAVASIGTQAAAIFGAGGLLVAKDAGK